MDGVDCIVKDLEELFPLLFLVLKGLHLDLVFILKIPVLLLLLINVSFYLSLLLYYLLLLQQILAILLDLLLQDLVRLHQFLPFLFNLGQKPLILILLFMKLFDFVFELFDQIEVGGCDFSIVSFDI